jgi:hypothetical protein
MALRDVCSPTDIYQRNIQSFAWSNGAGPSNIVSADLPLPVFMKNVFFSPLLSCDTIFDVDAELQPPPPAETDAESTSSCRSFRTAGSSFIVAFSVHPRAHMNI